MFTQLTVMQKFERSDLKSVQDNTTSETHQLSPLNMLHNNLKKPPKNQKNSSNICDLRKHISSMREETPDKMQLLKASSQHC